MHAREREAGMRDVAIANGDVAADRRAARVVAALGRAGRLMLLLAAVGGLPHARAARPPAPAAPPPAPARQTPTDLLVDGGDFELTIVGPDGKPITGASVDLQGDPPVGPAQLRRGEAVDRPSFGLAARADAEGRVAVHFAAVPQQLAVRVITPGFGPYRAEWSSRDRRAAIPARFRVELDAGWSVGGVVVDVREDPIAGAKVSPFVEFKTPTGARERMGVGDVVATDADGRWRFDSVPAGRADVGVEITSPGFAPFAGRLGRDRYGLAAEQEPAAPLKLSRGLTVVGTVLDDAGRPIAGALVRTKFHNDVRRATTGPDGNYRLEGCEAGAARVVVSAPGRAMDMRPVDVSREMEPVNFVMAPGGTVRVRVLGPEGKPEPRARIFVQRWRGRQVEYFEFDHVSMYADADGVFAWDEAPLDGFEADICPSGPDGMQLVREPVAIRPGEQVFRLPPTLVVAGRVVDAATGEAIQRFRVGPGGRWANSDRPHWDDRGAVDGADGRYQVRNKRVDGFYLLRVEAEGYAAATSREIRPEEGSVAVDFALTRMATIAIQVRTPDGQPAAGARVALGIEGAQINLRDGEIQGNATFAEVRTADADGRVPIPARERPGLLVIVHPSGYLRVAAPAQAPGDAATPLTLDPWAAVEGTFRVAGRPASNVRLALDPARGDHFGPGQPTIFTRYQANTDAAGHYRFDRVIPGPASIHREDSILLGRGSEEQRSSIPYRVSLAAGTLARFDCGGPGRAVVGTLATRAATAEPVRWNFYNLSGRAARRPDGTGSLYFTATVVRDGSFRVDDLPPGDYAVDANPQERAPDAPVLRAHQFRVPPADPARPDEPVDLGTLFLTVPQPAPPGEP